jgi:hypothetical protein
MSGWQPTKGTAAAIGGVHTSSMTSRCKNACCEKASNTPERRPEKAHGRIGRLARLVIERSSIDTGSACPRQHDPEAGRMVRVVGPIF